MKTIYFFLFIFLSTYSIAQPISETIDVNGGSIIEIKSIFYNSKKLYITSWNNPTENISDEYTLTTERDKEKPYLNFIFIKQSEMDSSFVKHVFIHNRDTMQIFIKKNCPQLRFVIQKFSFNKGDYLINLKELYMIFAKKDAIVIQEFPFPYKK